MRKNILIFVMGALVGAFAVSLYYNREVDIFDEEDGINEVDHGLEDGDVIQNDKQEDRRVLVMNKDIYKKVATNYSKTSDMIASVKSQLNETPSRPYIISVEDFNECDREYEQETLMYYQGDETLLDESEEIISNVNELIGDEALLNFGKNSDDPDVVYVRNEKLTMDYEIIRQEGSYSEICSGVNKKET